MRLLVLMLTSCDCIFQAFEPPLDMSLDVNDCDDQHPECSVEPHCHQDWSLSCSHDRLSSEPLVRSMKNEVTCDAEDGDMCRSLGRTVNPEVFYFSMLLSLC